MSWSRRFDEPILLPDGRKLRTLRETINWLAKEVPKSEHTMERFRPQRIALRGRAGHGAPMIFAQMGTMQAIHRHRERVFHPDRKEHHWARRKLSRDR